MYLHNDRELFHDAINLTYSQTGIIAQAIEKDYYVTLLLQLLSQKIPYIVFKGGTSLSKCHHAIDRFSEDIDITIDSKLSQGQMKKLKEVIKEISSILGLSIPNIDETWCRVRIKYKGDGTKLGKYFKKYVWVLVNKLDGLVYFLYDNDENDSRGCRPIEEFLGDFKGSIQSDGYVVYKHLSRTNPENVHLLCWAHVRAKFKYAEEINKDPDAAWFVEQIGLLYMVEAENIKFHRTVNEIKLRRSRADVTGILSALHARAEKMIKNGNHLHYGDLMNKALNYMLNGWDELQNYRMDGQHTIDNMIAERVIRPFTVNRKNSLFYSSEQGVDVAATYLTIIETAKIHGLEVWDYLVYVFREIMNENKDCSTYAPEAFLA